MPLRPPAPFDFRIPRRLTRDPAIPLHFLLHRSSSIRPSLRAPLRRPVQGTIQSIGQVRAPVSAPRAAPFRIDKPHMYIH